MIIYETVDFVKLLLFCPVEVGQKMAMKETCSDFIPEFMIRGRYDKGGSNVREWYENFDLLFIMILTGALIVVLQCVAGWLLGRLYRDSSMMGTTENSWIRGMIGRFEAGYQLKVPITDIPSFVDKNIAEYRFQRLSMDQWADIGIYGAWIECFMMGIITLIGISYQTSLYTFGIYGIYLILILAMIMGFDFFLRTHAYQRGIRVYLLDYMQNTLRPRMENHYLHPEEEKAYQQEYFMEEQTAVARETKEENRRIRVTREELSDEEKEALLSDVLEEYF